MQQLKDDGLYENTIIFLFSDHGTGLPGYKRWLNNAGLQVPFILHVPDTYKSWVANLNYPVTDKMVGFVDFAPTVLTLAGISVPEIMDGSNFLGENATPKEYIYGYRDRADDCYEMSRSVFDGRFIYVRHFMPQLPYFQDAFIFHKAGSYEEIQRLKNLNQLPETTQAMFQSKPMAMLFDLENDPLEQRNLAKDPSFASLIKKLDEKLETWMLEHFDTGLLNEGDMMERARKGEFSVYDAVREYSRYDFAKLLASAQQVGQISDPTEVMSQLKSPDSAIRFWGLVALDNYAGNIDLVKSSLMSLLEDQSLGVAAFAAEILIKRYNEQAAYQTLEKVLRSDFEPVVLQAAISIRKLEEKAAPLLPLIKNDIMPLYSGDIWGRYKNWSYPMFIGMALDQTQIILGEDIRIK